MAMLKGRKTRGLASQRLSPAPNAAHVSADTQEASAAMATRPGKVVESVCGLVKAATALTASSTPLTLTHWKAAACQNVIGSLPRELFGEDAILWALFHGLNLQDELLTGFKVYRGGHHVAICHDTKPGGFKDRVALITVALS